MDISVGIILLELGEHFKLVTNIENTEDFPVKLFQIWNGDTLEYDTLYIVTSENIKANPDLWFDRLVIGADLDSQVMKSCGAKWINVENENNFIRIVNELQTIFQKFNNWTSRIEGMSNNSASISSILDDLEKTYSIMSLLISKSLKFLSVSPNYSKYNPWVGGKNHMPLDILNELLADEEFRYAQNHDKVFIYYSPLEKSDAYSYCYNIKKEKEYCARLLLHSENYNKCNGLLYITELLGKKIAEIMNKHDFQDQDIYINNIFKQMIADLLKGIHKGMMEIKECLKELKWEQSHKYQIYLFQFLQDEVPNASHEYYRAQLEQFLGECYVIENNNKFICLINLTLTPEYKHNNRQILSVFLRDNLCKVGISSEFYDLAELNEYFQEADIALFIGTNFINTAWYYQFSDIVLPYLKYQMTRGINTAHLIHPSIKTLQEYDGRESTQLVKTIETYIRNKYNVTQTAEKLFIHRTTLLVRLDRIKQLTGVTFDDYEERLSLILSLMLM